jgi:cobalt-zinc-cadmium efflux system protein
MSLPAHPARHDHDRDHDHSGHGHAHAPESFNRAFAIGMALNFTFVTAEVFYGLAANLLALLADAAHNLSDALGLAGAWTAALLSHRRPDNRYTYGLRGTTILAALGNAILLLVVTGGIAWESIQRFTKPEDVAGLTIIVVAALGVAVNGVTALMFLSGRKGDLNIKAAFTHMASDALVALGVVGSGVLILLTGRLWLDPALSLLISVVIVVGTWSLLRDSTNLALDAVPAGIDQQAVAGYLSSLPGVTAVHDLHIWGMSTTETALTAHLVRPQGDTTDAFLHDVAHELEERFGICHSTLQVETDEAEACRLAPTDVV